MKQIKFIIILLTFIFFTLLGCLYKKNCDIQAHKFYLQGKAFYAQGKYSDAYYNFKQIKPISNLYKLSLLKQYQCAAKLSDKKTSYLKLKEIIKSINSDIVLPWALYNEASLVQEQTQNQDESLIKRYTYIENKFPTSDFATASAFKVAQLSKNRNPVLAKNNYIKYLEYAPSGKYSKISLEEVVKYSNALSKDDIKIVADAYLENEMYSQALEYYTKLPFASVWNKVAKCYRELKRSTEEKNTILKAFSLKENKVEEKEYAILVDRYVALSKKDKLTSLQKLYTDYDGMPVLPTIAFKLAQVSPQVRALKLYETIFNQYPNSTWASNSLWEVFWYNYSQTRYKTCENLAKKHISLYSKNVDAPRVAYWYGRALLKMRQNMRAREIFYDVINDYPLTYYAFLSARQLKMSKSKSMIVKKPIQKFDVDSLNNIIFKDKFLLALAYDGDWELIEEFKIDDEYIKSWIASKKGEYLTSINIAKTQIQKESEEQEREKIATKFSNRLLKLVYPIVYEDKINFYANEYKQSPYLFLSLVREESHFNKNAKSSAGALGLSQLLPSTASFIEKRHIDKTRLQNPDENIRIGLKYFNYLVNQFNGNEYLAILAYNAGPGNINKWIASPSIKSDEVDVFVENIPYLETKNYIKKILSSYWIYLNIYSSKNK